jgi:hypothetical protein
MARVTDRDRTVARGLPDEFLNPPGLPPTAFSMW